MKKVDFLRNVLTKAEQLGEDKIKQMELSELIELIINIAEGEGMLPPLTYLEHLKRHDNGWDIDV